MSEQHQVNIHMPAEMIAGVYANVAEVGHSAYEFTLTFARVDHENLGATGAVVSRVNLSPKCFEELLEVMQEALAASRQRQAIRDLPEAPER